MMITGKYAASNFFFTQGISVEPERGCYRLRYRYLSFINRVSRCLPLPKVSYVLVFKTLYAKCEACGIDDFERSGLLQLSLVYGRNRRLIINESEDRTAIFEQARQLAAGLRVRLRDSATDRRQPKWITVPVAT
jgi:hypothetical protein